MLCVRDKCDEWMDMGDLTDCHVGGVFEDEDGDVFMLCLDSEICDEGVLGIVYLCDESGEGCAVGKWYDLCKFCNVTCKRVCAKVVIS